MACLLFIAYAMLEMDLLHTRPELCPDLQLFQKISEEALLNASRLVTEWWGGVGGMFGKVLAETRLRHIRPFWTELGVTDFSRSLHALEVSIEESQEDASLS